MLVYSVIMFIVAIVFMIIGIEIYKGKTDLIHDYHQINVTDKSAYEKSFGKAMLVISTDGMENASKKYTSERVKQMIERQKERYGWEFLFIGANIDAVETAARYGIDKNRAVNYNADKEGTRVLYESVSRAVCKLRSCTPLSADWSADIDADYKNRGRRN